MSYLTTIKIRWFGLFVCLFFFFGCFCLGFCFVLLCSFVRLYCFDFFLFAFFSCCFRFDFLSCLLFLLFYESFFFSFSFFFFVCRKENNSMFRESLLVLKTHCIKTYTLLPCFALCLILLR